MTSDAMITRFQAALGDTNKLSDAIVAKVKPVLDTMIKKRADLLADTTVDPADLQTKMTAITTEASDAIKAIVTPAQFAIIQPLLQRAGRGGGRGGRGGGGGGGALRLRLQGTNPSNILITQGRLRAVPFCFQRRLRERGDKTSLRANSFLFS